MSKRHIKNNVGCACAPYIFGAQAHPTKSASHVGWVKPRQRRTQQNLIVRRVSLAMGRTPECAVHGYKCRESAWMRERGLHPTYIKSLCRVHVSGAAGDD